MLLDGYVRVSQVAGRSGASFISPDLQRERIAKWCALSGATLATVHIELDESGANPERPLLQDALARVESGQTQGVVVARMDRFGRSLLHSLQAIERIDRAGGTFVSVDDGLDLTTNTGRLVVRIMLSLAEFELDRIRDAWRDSGRKAVERGLHFGAVPPTGYLPSDGEPLRIDPATGPWVRAVFERRAAGEGLSAICRWLEANDVRTSRGGTGWHTSTLSNILSNRVYVGEAHRGEFSQAHAHPAIVDAPLWHRAQLPRQTPTSRPVRGDLFGGFLRCAGCRMKMHATTVKGRVYWACDPRKAFGRCAGAATIGAVAVEPLLVDALKRRLAHLAAPSSDAHRRADAALAAADAAVERYRDNAALEASLGPERYARGLQTRMATLQRAALEAARLQDSGAVNADAGTDWHSLSPTEQRFLLARHLDCAFVARSRLPAADRVFICWRGEAPPDLPSVGPPPVRCARLTRRPAWGARRLGSGRGRSNPDGRLTGCTPSSSPSRSGSGVCPIGSDSSALGALTSMKRCS